MHEVTNLKTAITEMVASLKALEPAVARLIDETQAMLNELTEHRLLPGGNTERIERKPEHRAEEWEDDA